VFIKNSGDEGGGIASYLHSNISFKEYSDTTFSNNTADRTGGSVAIKSSFVTIEGNSITTFTKNEASKGGAVYCTCNATITFSENSNTTFSDNSRTNGEVLHLVDNCTTKLNENSVVMFNNNNAKDSDRIIYAEYRSDITFDDNSTVTFTISKITFGELIHSYINSKIIVKGNSTIIFNDLLPKWCANTCVQYNGQNDVVKIDINGIVLCSNQKAFMCISENCHCNKLEEVLGKSKK